MTPPDTGPVAPRTAEPIARTTGMDRIRIRGGKRLSGTLPISGAKNAALPLMAAALLTDKTLTLSNLPYLADITSLSNLLLQLGVKVTINGNGGMKSGRVVELTAARIANTTASYDLVRKMRARNRAVPPS